MAEFVKLKNNIFKYGAAVTLAATGASEAAAEAAANFARDNVPVDSGTLKASITSDGDKAQVGGGEAYYAGFVDMGTATTPATGFWKKAVNKAKRQYYSKCKKIIRSAPGV